MSKATKRRIKQNVWGNWNGYEGARKTMGFGTDERGANEWLQTGEKPNKPGRLVMAKFDWQK